MKKKVYKKIKIIKVSNAIGATIEGVELNKSLDKETISEIYDAFLRFKVIFFRNQNFTPESLLFFAKNIGKPIIYPFVQGLKNFPEITPILKKKSDVYNFGGVWHSDTTYLKKPPKASMLYALEVPESGGDTEFSNQNLAYESLSNEMKKVLLKLKAHYISGKEEAAITRSDLRKHSSSGLKSDALEAIHPVIRTHPETKLKSLYINEAHTTQFEGMTKEESVPLLNFLYKHQINPNFNCRFKWEKGSVAIWDNRCTMHNAINDYHGSKRLMYRVTFQGSKPY